MENNKKNIGILFPPRKGNGGIFQYAISIAEALINFCDDFNYTVVYFDGDEPKDFLKVKDLENLKYIKLSLDKKNKILSKIQIILSILAQKPLFMLNKINKKLLNKSGIDLLILPAPQLPGFQGNLPYILPIPDMNYKHYAKKFPELSSVKSRIISDVFFKYMARHALLCVADSQMGKNDIMNFLGQSEEKVVAIPFIPPGYIYYYKDMGHDDAGDLLRQYNLPEKFIFYPAQFWPHKNHLGLIEAIGILKEKHNAKVNLVLVGNAKVDPKHFERIEALIKKLDIASQIFILGYVSDKEVVALYKRSLALVFPTFAGPTNIPPVEGMILGVPVICSNAFAMPEQLGNAGILFDPEKPSDMAEKIYNVWSDGQLRQDMIKKGYEKVKNLTAANYAQQWILAVKKAINNGNYKR